MGPGVRRDGTDYFEPPVHLTAIEG